MALDLATKIRAIKGVNDLLIPQDLDYPAMRLDVDRERASHLGPGSKRGRRQRDHRVEFQRDDRTELLGGPADRQRLSADRAIPRKSGQVSQRSETDSAARCQTGKNPTPLDSVVKLTPIESPTEVDHYQLRRVFDLYVAPATENLGGVTKGIQKVLKDVDLPEGVQVDLRGSVQGMNQSFTSFGFGLILSVVLVFLILVAQFQSFIDPFVILLAIPPGITGVIVLLLVTATTLNVMSLMGVVMMVGHRGVQQYFNRGIHADTSRGRKAAAGGGGQRVSRALEADSDDFARNHPGFDSHGAEVRHRLRSLCAVGTCHNRRAAGFRGCDCLPGSRSLHSGAPQRRTNSTREPRVITRLYLPVAIAIFGCLSAQAQVQTPPPNPTPPPAPIQQNNPGPSEAANALATHAVGPTLTLKEAEDLALKRNPQITVGRLQALVSQQNVRESRSALMPNAYLSVTAADSHAGSRITAGALNNPIIFPRAASGVRVSQLITDFGRTSNLVASSEYQAKAEDMLAQATAAQIVLAVDQAFFNALETKALVTVAQETVTTRQTFVDKIQALTSAKLKSDIDLSFANVDLARGRLLLLEAINNYETSLNALSAILGYQDQQNFQPIEQVKESSPPAPEETPWSCKLCSNVQKFKRYKTRRPPHKNLAPPSMT